MRRVRFASVLNARGGEWLGPLSSVFGVGPLLSNPTAIGTTSGARVHLISLLPQPRTYAGGVRLSVAKGDRNSRLSPNPDIHYKRRRPC